MEVIVLATFMAIFGVVGYLRGTRSTLLTAAVIWLGLLAFGRAGPTVAKYVNTLYVGIKIAPTAVQAMASGDRAAFDTVFTALKTAKALIATDGSGPGLPLLLMILAGISLLLGLLNLLRGASSVMGLLLGLGNGYLLGSYLWNSLHLGTVMPLPFGLSKPRISAGWGPSSAPAGGDLVERLFEFVTHGASQQTLALLIVVLVAVFVIVATRFTNRPTKRG